MIPGSAPPQLNVRMARQPRLDLPGIPQHVVQRGNNRMPCFLDDDDRQHYLGALRESLLATRCLLHAYVLMKNHAHLLVTPPEQGAVARMMQKLGRQYVGHFNARHGRSGTLWEGRYKACLVDSETYVLRCARYIDLNPVRARIIDDPRAYPWSSCAALCSGREDPLLTLHPAQRALGDEASQRGRAYMLLLDEAVSDDERKAIRVHIQQQRAWGRAEFIATVASRTGRFAGVRPAHRPRAGEKGIK